MIHEISSKQILKSDSGADACSEVPLASDDTGDVNRETE